MFYAADSGNIVLGMVSEIVTSLTSVVSLLTQPVVLPFTVLAFVTAAVGTWKKLIPAKKK
ncbi:hypothetical protein D3C78_488550 [compost metagenome]